MEATYRPLHGTWKISWSVSKAIGKASDVIPVGQNQSSTWQIVLFKVNRPIQQICTKYACLSYIDYISLNLETYCFLLCSKKGIQRHTFCVCQFHGTLVHMLFFFQMRQTKHLTSHHRLWLQGINVKVHVKVPSQSSLENRRSLSMHPHNICMWVKRIYFHFCRHCMRLEFEELPDMVMITIWLIFSILLLHCWCTAGL